MSSKKQASRRPNGRKVTSKDKTNQYYLTGDGKALSLQNVQLNNTRNRTFTMEFMVDSLFSVFSQIAVNSYGSWIHRLVDIPNITNWSTLFDKYKVDAVDLSIVPVAMSTSTASTTNPPNFATAVDFDSAVTPTSFASVLRLSRSALTTGLTPIRRHYRPRCQSTVYAGGITSGYMEAKAESWIDCANTSVEHYGLVYALGTAPVASQFVYRCNAKYTVTFAFPIG